MFVWKIITSILGPRAHGPWAHGPWALGPWAHGPLGPWALGPWALGPKNGPKSLSTFLTVWPQDWPLNQPVVSNHQWSVTSRQTSRMVRKMMKMDPIRVLVRPHGPIFGGNEPHHLQEAFARAPGPPGPQKYKKTSKIVKFPTILDGGLGGYVVFLLNASQLAIACGLHSVRHFEVPAARRGNSKCIHDKTIHDRPT